MMRFRQIFSIFLSISSFAATEVGCVWVESDKLFEPEGIKQDTFGHSVAIFQDTAVIGSPDRSTWIVDASGKVHEGNRMLRGLAYVFVRDRQSGRWRKTATLDAPDVSWEQYFGSRVAIHNDTIVVSSSPFILQYSNGDSKCHEGAAYVFARNSTGSWNRQAIITEPDSDEFLCSGTGFPSALSLYQNSLVIGASKHPPKTGLRGFEGTAYVFVRDGTIWTQQAKLLSTSSTNTSRNGNPLEFGKVVEIYKDVVCVGSSGKVYMFQRKSNKWSHTQQLELPPFPYDGYYASSRSGFGSYISLDADTLVVGENAYARGIGASYVYTRHGIFWTLQTTLVLDGRTRIVREDVIATTSLERISFFRFDGTSWTETESFLPGWSTTSIAAFEDTMLVGNLTYLQDNLTNAVHVFQYQEEPTAAPIMTDAPVTAPKQKDEKQSNSDRPKGNGVLRTLVFLCACCVLFLLGSKCRQGGLRERTPSARETELASFVKNGVAA